MDIYTEPPRIAGVRRDGARVELRFTKRIDPETASEQDRYRVTIVPETKAADRQETAEASSDTPRASVAGVEVDESRIFLEIDGLQDGRMVELTVRGLRDVPARRLFHDHEAAVQVEQMVRFRY